MFYFIKRVCNFDHLLNKSVRYRNPFPKAILTRIQLVGICYEFAKPYSFSIFWEILEGDEQVHNYLIRFYFMIAVFILSGNTLLISDGLHM